ncbi:MAG: hypothetical protein K5985_02530 [Lachnospiraceae bacterium]|nr:hypothetical protein [Lachnospiraceae bacterium]
MKDNTIFREKNLQRISSPEQLNDYIRVSTPALWILLVAITLLLIGALVWASFGTLDVHTSSDTVETVHPMEFVTN